MTDSQRLLAEYVQTGSDAAFRELVTRYVGLVYSTARRLVDGDTHRAEDVAQIVFVDLARTARTLPSDVLLGGWLHRHTCFVAAKTMRGERRRQSRERQAVEMNAFQNNSGPDYSRVAPILDEAINELGEEDRTAILLRFFEQHDFRSVGQALGGNEDAARMRVNRALDKLQNLIKRRGVTTSATALSVVLSANAVQAAPVGLAVTISTAAALAGTTIATTATATVTKAIAMTTLQKTLITATLVAGVATPLVIQHQAQVKLRDENALLRQQVEQFSPLTAENERLSNLVARPNAALSSDQLNDLLRLRGEVGMLRRQTNELGKLREENRRLQDAQAKAGQKLPSPNSPQDRAGQVDFPRESWTFAGYANPESTILSLASAAVGGDVETFLNSLTPDFHARQRQNWEPKSDVEIRDKLVKEFGQTKAIRILNKETISENEIILSLLIQHDDGGNETPKMKVQRIGNEWKMAGPYEPPTQKAP